MKDIKMFMFEACPHCKLARRLMTKLQEEDPRYAALRIEMIDEKKQPEIADQYDYYYVPTYFVDGQKVHEGHAELDDVKKVFDLALAD